MPSVRGENILQGTSGDTVHDPDRSGGGSKCQVVKEAFTGDRK